MNANTKALVIKTLNDEIEGIRHHAEQMMSDLRVAIETLEQIPLTEEPVKKP